MKRSILMFLVIGTAIIFFGCSGDNPLAPKLNQSDQAITSLAKKSAPSINCTTEYHFVGHLGEKDGEGRTLVWEGTISGDIEGVIKWWSMLNEMLFTGQASHYEQRFKIWNANEELLLVGDDAGTTTARHEKNSNWRANGTIILAYGDFADYFGRQAHSAGHFTWVAPEFPYEGTGTFRVN